MKEQYRRSVNRIALALLIFVALGYAQSALLSALVILTEGMSAMLGEVVYECASGFLYALQFCLPVLLFRHLPPAGPCVQPYLACKLPRNSALYILLGVSLVSASAYLNSFVVSIFHYREFSSEVLWDHDVSANYQLVLMFLTLVVIPAFVEELLFRGVVLSNLLPYGETTAIFGSAILFGLMHRNIEQIFYATAAGVVIGWIYVRTKSIWVCVLLHFFNNFQTVLSTAVSERLPAEQASGILYVIEGTVFLLGILSGIFLFVSEKKEEREAQPSKEAPPVMSVRERILGFLSVPMIVFCAFCLVEMALLLVLSQLYLN